MESIDRSKFIYVYLDFNILQYLKNRISPRGSSEVAFNCEELTNCIAESRRKYLFPISRAHLLDLSKSVPSFFKEDLDFLIYFSGNFCVAFDESGEDSFPIKKENGVYLEFYKIINEKNEKNEILITGGFDFNVEMKKIQKTHVFYDFLSRNNGRMNSRVMTNLLNHHLENSNNPDWYNTFRKSINSLKKIDKNSAIHSHPDLLTKYSPFIEFINSNSPYDFVKEIDKVMDSFYSMSGDVKFKNLSLYQKIDILYHVIDYNLFFSERISKKNKPDNMAVDVLHLISATNARYFVTADRNSYHKSKFICMALKLKVKPLLPQEFIHKFC